MTTLRSPKFTLMLGAAWAVSTRWVIKGIGFLNTIIMARLVMPADYGIVAMAMLVVGLTQALMDFGATTALMRKDEVSRDEIDSAWTLRWMQSMAMGLVLLVGAPFAASYFQEPRVQYVLWVLAACVAIAGANNMGTVLAQKAFNFSLEFKQHVICKILSVIATVLAGYFLGDYRALVIGVATSYLSGLLLSYGMHPYRPRWNTKKIGEIWAVTKWLMLAGVGSFVLRKGDELIAARIGTTADYGVYNVGSDLGQMPTGEVGPAMLKALMPVLVAMRGSVQEVNAVVIKTVGAMNTVTLPIGLGFAAVAAPATSLILGSAWSDAAQYVAAFALVGTLQIIQSPFNTLLTIRGHTKVQGIAVWIEFAVFLAVSAVLVPSLFLMGLVWARMLGSLVNLSVVCLAARRLCAISLRATAIALVRPAMGAIMMYGLVQSLVQHVEGDALKLGVGIAFGAMFYLFWAAFTWVIAGRPDGLESTALDFFRKNMKKSY